MANLSGNTFFYRPKRQEYAISTFQDGLVSHILTLCFPPSHVDEGILNTRRRLPIPFTPNC